MGEMYDNEERERIRRIFARHRREGEPIAYCAEQAGIATSTYYAWNEDDAWKKANGWNKGDGWDK